MSGWYILTLIVVAGLAFWFGRGRARQMIRLSGGAQANARGAGHFHSLPIYHGLLAAAAVAVVMLAVLLVGNPLVQSLATSQALGEFPAAEIADPLQRSKILRDIGNAVIGQHSGTVDGPLAAASAKMASITLWGNGLVFILGLIVGFAALLWIYRRIGSEFRARNRFEAVVKWVLIACASVAVLTTIGIVFSVMFETFRFFFDPALKGRPTVTEFLFGTEWNPQAALRADQGDIRTAFGFIPLLTGTLLITFIAILVAGPLGLLSAIYLSEYASKRVRAVAKPLLELLAGIPTVVLGFFAALTVAPSVRGFGQSIGLDVASESALAAGLVMGMMIIPFISSLSDDVMNAVPQSLRDAAYGLGSTQAETIRNVVLPAALPGIVSAFMLAISRAIGETMIVVMAAGLAANLTANPFDAVTTITVQIKTILVGDQEFDSAKTLAAFALGFVLFFVTLVLNIIALRVVQKYREQYD
jgi:phosphate transport system permease protein